MIIKRVGTNVNETKKVAGKPGLKFCLVQILVVVAIIHVGKLEGRWRERFQANFVRTWV